MRNSKNVFQKVLKKHFVNGPSSHYAIMASYWFYVSSDAASSLIKCMLRTEPIRRPTAEVVRVLCLSVWPIGPYFRRFADRPTDQ